MFMLDRCAEKVSLLLIHGLAGQGKTTLLREFLWWRARTGDSRRSIWIDFERMSSVRDVFWHMAQALPNPPDRTIDIDWLEHHLAEALAANPSWIIWDHLHAVHQQQEGGPPNHFNKEDRTRLATWLGRLAGTQSAVLAASRAPEPWLFPEPGRAALPLGGLNAQDRWQLVNQLLTNAAEPDATASSANIDLLEALKRAVEAGGTSIGNTTTPNVEVGGPKKAEPRDKGLLPLVFYAAGHPLITIDVVARVRQGQSAQVIHDALRTDLSQLRPWQVEESDARRLDQSLSCLDDTSVRPVLPLLSLHEELIDESLFRQMMRQIHGDEGDHIVDLAFARLEAAGLFAAFPDRIFLHPAVGGALRCNAELAPSDDVRCVFVDTVADRLAHSVENAPPPTFTMGTLHSAMVMAADQKRTNVAMAIGRRIAQFWTDRRDFERAITTQHELVAMCESNADDENVVRTLLFAAETARMGRNVDQSECWLKQAESRVEHMHNELPHAVRAQLHYQRGKLAELCGKIDTYREAMFLAQHHADQASDEQLVELIAYEVAQLSIRSGNAAEAEHAAGVLSHSTLPHVRAGAFRTQGQAQLAKGNYDEARMFLQRAIALDDQADNTIGKAMNLSLLGEVEGRANNLHASRTAFEEAVALFEAAGDRQSAAVTYHQWAKTFYLNDLMEEAGEYFIHSASIFSEVNDQATFETVQHNFHIYLGEVGTDFASHMALKWISAKLPASEMIGHIAKGLFADISDKSEPERTDQ
jgi:tetratricopeptide (TPR) repeat protein